MKNDDQIEIELIRIKNQYYWGLYRNPINQVGPFSSLRLCENDVRKNYKNIIFFYNFKN